MMKFKNMKVDDLDLFDAIYFLLIILRLFFLISLYTFYCKYFLLIQPKQSFLGIIMKENLFQDLIIYINRYRLDYSFKMGESSHIRHEYLTLKDKIENKIKQLELKCNDHSYTYFTEQLKTPNTHSAQSHSLETLRQFQPNPNPHCCCSHSCFHESRVSWRDYQPADRKKINNQHSSITEALMQNLKAQKQMNGNLKMLSDKLSEISERKSEPAQFCQDRKSVSSKREILLPPYHTEASSQESQFSRSRSMNNSHKKNKLKFKKVSKEKSLGRKNSKISDDKKLSEYYPSITQQKNQKLKNKKIICPLHDFQDIKDQYQSKIKYRQVFRDSNYRNLKHEKNHLVGSYYQQQKSRKQLLAKIAKNFYNNYGVK